MLVNEKLKNFKMNFRFASGINRCTTTKICEGQDLVDIKKHINFGNLHILFTTPWAKMFSKCRNFLTLMILVENLPFILFWRKPA